jgi:hypothetical protein
MQEDLKSLSASRTPRSTTASSLSLTATRSGLYVTEAKAAGGVPYEDKLIGDELPRQGQALGRTDELIINPQGRRQRPVRFL